MNLTSHIQDSVVELEQLIAQAPQTELVTEHALENGMYSRTIFIPAGCVLTGAEHKTDHLNVVVGDILVTTDEGVKRITGHKVLQTKAGQKRAGYALIPTIWTTICRTDFKSLDDLEKIEDALVVDAKNLMRRRILPMTDHLKVQ